MGLAEPGGEQLCLGVRGDRSGSWRAPVLFQGWGTQELGLAGQDKLKWIGLVNGPSAFPDPMACPSQKHKLTLTHTGLALGEWGRWCGTPQAVYLLGSAEWWLAGTLVSVQMDLRPSRGCGLPQPEPLPSPAHPSPAPGSTPKRRSVHSASPSACLPFRSSPWSLLFPGSPLLHCVRAWGLRSCCLAQIHILFLSLCNNQCFWWSRDEPGPEEEAEAASSEKPSARLCRCDYCTPSRCTVSTV